MRPGSVGESCDLTSLAARSFVKSKKSGKTTLTVGGAQGAVSPLDEHPIADATIEVAGVEIVQTVCNAL